MNPQHTIPLLNDNGTIIYDSHAICAYLCNKYSKNDKLYPKDWAERAKVEARLHFDTGYLFARFRAVVEPILYYGGTEVNAKNLEYLEKAYPILESFLEVNPYLCGKEFTIADFCCFATITSVNSLFPIDFKKFGKVRAWMDRMDDIEYCKKINEDGIVSVEGVMQQVLAHNKLKQMQTKK